MTDEPVLSPFQQKIIDEIEAQSKAGVPPTTTLSRSFMDRMASSVVDPSAPLPQDEASSSDAFLVFRP